MSVVIVNGVRVNATWREVIDPSQIAKLLVRASQVLTEDRNKAGEPSHRVPGPDSGGGPGQIFSASVALRLWPPGRSGVP